MPSHEALCAHAWWQAHDERVKCSLAQKLSHNWTGDTFYMNLQPDGAMSRVLTESQCSGDEREIEWTIPVIGLSTHFSKFSG